MMVANGLERDPKVAIETTLNQILDMMHTKGITDPLRFTSILSHGSKMWAVRFSSDEHAPSLYYKRFAEHVVVGSEPLDLSGDGWEQVQPGHIMTIEDLTFRSEAMF